jgi:hypothetical protein
MAITVYSRHDCDILFGRQVAWGTPTADAAALQLFDGENAVVHPDFNIRTPNRSNSGSRTLQDFNIQQDGFGASPKIELSGDFKIEDGAHWLYAAIQGLTSEAVGSPFRKIFTFPTTQPDFTAISALTSAGYIATIVERQPVSGKSATIRDAICTGLTLTCAPDAGNGRMQMKATMIARGPANLASTPSGTNVRGAQTFINFHEINGFSGDALPLIPLGVEITISQPKTKGISMTAGGAFLTYVIPEYEVTAKITVVDDANARTLRANWGTTHSKAWIISWVTLLFNLNATITAAPKMLGDVNAIEFTLRGVRASSTAALTATIDDSVDRGWT